MIQTELRQERCSVKRLPALGVAAGDDNDNFGGVEDDEVDKLKK